MRKAIIAFDADVLIYSASPDHSCYAAIQRLMALDEVRRIGSVLLLSEVLTKPLRTRLPTEVERLHDSLGRLELLPCNEPTAALAVTLGAEYGLRTIDALHLATAVRAGADYFVTNNHKDFTPDIKEVEIVAPDRFDSSV